MYEMLAYWEWKIKVITTFFKLSWRQTHMHDGICGELQGSFLSLGIIPPFFIHLFLFFQSKEDYKVPED